MKIQVRNGVFETNSSSTHALVLGCGDKSKCDEEIVSAIRHGMLNVGFYSITQGDELDTFMGKLAYLTALRICSYARSSEYGSWDVDGVKSCEEVKDWEHEVLARLAGRGIRCEGFDYDDLVECLNSEFGLDHQVVECGCDSVGSSFQCLEHRWVEKTNGYTHLSDGRGEDAKKKWVTTEHDVPPSSDIDVLFDDDVGIRYGWDSDGYYSDVESFSSLSEAVKAAKAELDEHSKDTGRGGHRNQ